MVFLFGALAFGAVSGHAQSLKLDVVDVKTAMIGKIAEFVVWPADAGLEPGRPFELVVFGNSPLEAAVTRYYQNVRIAGHRVYVRRARNLDDIDRPHLLLLGPSVEAEPEAVLARLARLPVLTVSDSDGYARRGVGVNLYIAEDQVRFEISRRALERHRLKASFRLLTLARLIDDQQARR